MYELRCDCIIQEIGFNEAKTFIGKQSNLIVKSEYKYFALLESGEIRSVLGVSICNNRVKVHCNYTPLNLRSKGYFSLLLNTVCNIFSNKIITADCLEASKNIYLKCGFKLISEKHYKKFNIYRVKKEVI